MNKMLNLASIIMRKKPGYKSGHKLKIFDNEIVNNSLHFFSQGCLNYAASCNDK